MKNCGVPSEKINCNIQKRATGIARDILKECQFGYNAVAIGRRGLGQMDESMLGSIAAKVFINVVDAPVCLHGGKPKPGKIMIGLDNSLAAIRAVNFAGKMLNTADADVCLTHIVRIPATSTGRPLDEKNVEKIYKEHEKEMKPIFENAVKTLTAAGIAPAKITTKLVKSDGSRAVCLFNEAKNGKYGTVVVGRKGVNDVQEFTMGRIPYKLGQIAKNIALWLVP